jgi:hypothetical protein
LRFCVFAGTCFPRHIRNFVVAFALTAGGPPALHRVLHILNGDSTLGILEQTDLPGTYLVWREALMAGPTPATSSQDEWIEIRARHLADAYGGAANDPLAALKRQYSELEKFSDHDQVVLWFEYDMFCQLNLIYILDWFAKREIGKTQLELVCMAPRPDGKRGLGELEPADLAVLYAAREKVGAAHFEAASRAWRAYSSSDPRQIEECLATDLSALPFLLDTLVCHLQRFPHVETGLNFIAQQVLRMTDDGDKSFAELFTEFGRAAPLYGMGDAQFWNELKDLQNARNPLILVETTNGDGARNYDVRISITDAGRSVLKGEGAFGFDHDRNDRWLGGVHLTKDNLWFWNERERKLVGLREGNTAFQ